LFFTFLLLYYLLYFILTWVKNSKLIFLIAKFEQSITFLFINNISETFINLRKNKFLDWFTKFRETHKKRNLLRIYSRDFNKDKIPYIQIIEGNRLLSRDSISQILKGKDTL
jgi:hypothetical protein